MGWVVFWQVTTMKNKKCTTNITCRMRRRRRKKMKSFLHERRNLIKKVPQISFTTRMYSTEITTFKFEVMLFAYFIIISFDKRTNNNKSKEQNWRTIILYPRTWMSSTTELTTIRMPKTLDKAHAHMRQTKDDLQMKFNSILMFYFLSSLNYSSPITEIYRSNTAGCGS